MLLPVANEEEYVEKAKVLVGELDLEWETVSEVVQCSDLILALTIIWLYEHRGLIGMGRFRVVLSEVGLLKESGQLRAFKHFGYSPPEPIKDDDVQSTQFLDSLFLILRLHDEAWARKSKNPANPPP